VSPRACLVVAVLSIAACQGAAGRDLTDGSVASAPPGCRSYPYGSVLVLSGNPSRQTVMASRFQPTAGATCMDVTMGSCVATTTMPSGNTPALVGAGAITVSGGATMLTQTPQSSASGTSYANLTSMQSLWQGGEAIMVAAAGGDVPAFATTLSAPTQATLTAPAASGGGALTVSRQADLQLAWMGDSYGTVDVELIGPSAQTVDIHCRYAPSAHAGVVPAALLAMLPATTGGALIVTSNSAATVGAGAWSVDARLQTPAVDGGGALANYTVTFP